MRNGEFLAQYMGTLEMVKCQVQIGIDSSLGCDSHLVMKRFQHYRTTRYEFFGLHMVAAWSGLISIVQRLNAHSLESNGCFGSHLAGQYSQSSHILMDFPENEAGDRHSSTIYLGSNASQTQWKSCQP